MHLSSKSRGCDLGRVLGCLVICFWLQLTASTISQDSHPKTPTQFALELSNSSLTQNRIVRAINNYYGRDLEDDDRSRIRNSSGGAASRAALACYISSLIFTEKSSTADDYVNASYGLEYTNKVEVNWSELCWLPSRCIIAPKTTQEVALALSIITFTSAKFAVRSGGHNPNPTWASIDENGLLLDLYRLNNLTLSQDKKVLTVGPGNRWSEVYRYLNATEVSAVGARVPEVGVGGLSYFPSESGLSCDNVRNFQVVLGNSSVVNANKQTNPDLFASLKGGGANFGIVTRFDLYTAAYGQIWFELNQYEASQMPQLLAALVEYQAAAEFDTKAGLIFSPELNTTTIGLFYAAPTARPAVFQSFYSIPVYQTIVPSTTGTQMELSTALSSPAFTPTKYDVVAASTKVDLRLYQDIYAAFVAVSSNFSRMTGENGTMLFSLQPLTTQAILRGRAMGQNTLGLSAEPQQWFTSTIQWTDAAYDRAAHDAVTSLGEAVTSMARSRNLSIAILNPNDATFSQYPLQSFGSKSVSRMKATSAKYDPAGVFQTLQNGGFLLDRN